MTSGLIDIVLAVFILPELAKEYFNYIYIHDILLGYFVLVPLLTNGQTLGQFMFGFKLISLMNEKLTFLQLISRQHYLYI